MYFGFTFVSFDVSYCFFFVETLGAGKYLFCKVIVGFLTGLNL